MSPPELLQCACCAYPGRNPVRAEYPQRNECFKDQGQAARFRGRVTLTCLHWQPHRRPFYCEQHLYTPEPGSGLSFCPACETPEKQGSES